MKRLSGGPFDRREVDDDRSEIWVARRGRDIRILPAESVPATGSPAGTGWHQYRLCDGYYGWVRYPWIPVRLIGGPAAGHIVRTPAPWVLVALLDGRAHVYRTDDPHTAMQLLKRVGSGSGYRDRWAEYLRDDQQPEEYRHVDVPDIPDGPPVEQTGLPLWWRGEHHPGTAATAGPPPPSGPGRRGAHDD